jgi:hypothetical protein
MKRTADAFHAAEVERWREAWGAFWARVAALAPEADAALDRLTRAASDAELDAWADGSAPIFEAVRTLGAEWERALDAELGPDPCTNAWAAWHEGTFNALPRTPDAPLDLAAWPWTVEPPPPLDAARLDAERAFLLARLAEAATDAETMGAAYGLEFMATAEAIVEARRKAMGC